MNAGSTDVRQRLTAVICFVCGTALVFAGFVGWSWTRPLSDEAFLMVWLAYVVATGGLLLTAVVIAIRIAFRRR